MYFVLASDAGDGATPQDNHWAIIFGATTSGAGSVEAPSQGSPPLARHAMSRSAHSIERTRLRAPREIQVTKATRGCGKAARNFATAYLSTSAQRFTGIATLSSSRRGCAPEKAAASASTKARCVRQSLALSNPARTSLVLRRFHSARGRGSRYTNAKSASARFTGQPPSFRFCDCVMQPAEHVSVRSRVPGICESKKKPIGTDCVSFCSNTLSRPTTGRGEGNGPFAPVVDNADGEVLHLAIADDVADGPEPTLRRQERIFSFTQLHADESVLVRRVDACARRGARPTDTWSPPDW